MKNKNSVVLLSCLLINNVTSMFIYTYLLAFILDISSNGILNVATFYCSLHVSMIAFSWLFAPLFKKIKKSNILSFGIFFKCIFILMVGIFKDSIINYIILIALFNAASEVLFWGGANPLLPIITQKNKLVSFMSAHKILGNIISIIVPIIMGYFIDVSGINVVALIIGILITIQLLLSFCISEEDTKKRNKPHFREFVNSIKLNYPKAKKIYVNLFLFGFCSNISTIMLYYTVVTFGSNISLGIFSTISSIIGIIVLLIFNYKRKYFSTYTSFIIFSSLMLVSVIFVLIELSKVSLIIFYLIWNISIIIPDTITGSLRLNIIKRKGLTEYNIENVTISETYLDAGRIIGEILLLIMGVANSRVIDVLCLVITTIGVVIFFIYTSIINKQSSSISTITKA